MKKELIMPNNATILNEEQMIEVNGGEKYTFYLNNADCKSVDFVAKNPEFKEFLHNVAMQVVANRPLCVSIDELPAEEIVARNKDLMIVRDPIFAQNKEEYAIAVKKGNTELLASINKTIADMKANGEYEALVNAFMPVDGGVVHHIAVVLKRSVAVICKLAVFFL